MEKISIVQRRFGRAHSVETSALRRARKRNWADSADEVLTETVESGLEQGPMLSETPTLPEVVCLLSEIASIAKVSSPAERGEDLDSSRATPESLVASLSRIASSADEDLDDSGATPESLIASLSQDAAAVGPDEDLDDSGATPEREGKKVVDIELGRDQQEILGRSLPLEEMEVGDSREVPAVLTKESALKVIFRFGGEEDVLLTTREACRLLRVSKSFLYRKIRAGELSCLRVGRYLRFRKKELVEKLLKGQAGPLAVDDSAKPV